MIEEQQKPIQSPEPNLKTLKKHHSSKIAEYYSISNVADIMKVSKSTVRNMMYVDLDDPLPYKQWRRVIRIPIGEFHAWLVRQVRH